MQNDTVITQMKTHYSRHTKQKAKKVFELQESLPDHTLRMAIMVFNRETELGAALPHLSPLPMLSTPLL